MAFTQLTLCFILTPLAFAPVLAVVALTLMVS